MNCRQVYKKWIHTLLVALATGLAMAFLTACGDSPLYMAGEDIEDAEDWARNDTYYSMEHEAQIKASSSSMAQARSMCEARYNSTCCSNCYYAYGYYECSYCTNKCYDDYGYYICYSSSSYRYSSSSYYSYYSSSSSAPAKTYYLKTSKTMKFSLTYYKQVSSDWDIFDNAGDPEVSFTVYCYSEGSLLKSLSTGLLLDKEDVTSWIGTSSKTLTIPVNTDEIKVCPKVVDDDPSSDDEKTVSGGCKTVSDVGYLTDYSVQEQYQYTSVYKIDWEWYLY
ncbi:hypothetical protein SAMN05720781_1734 [Fibrobacter sp. UWT3]|uniref:hypothetical protein n=1 Tax=Fibrobacter sp. UWT3 TaxID=1896225 RepID=UPI000BDB2D21|nr:hypothetical protein [Fibrobacter sp. UWT3]SOE75672.1 hypothetical protein SAMN05720781_1734 [Fibrobacter sp. UWT3]